MGARIDLHMHTNNSDGVLSPAELLIELQEKKIEIASITDHDTLATYKSNLFMPNKLKIVPGVEIITRTSLGNVELLCYGFNYRQAATISYLERSEVDLYREIFERTKRQLLALGFILGDAEYEEDVYANITIFNALIQYEKNFTLFPQLRGMDALRFYRELVTVEGTPFHVDSSDIFPTVDRVVTDFRDLGGKVFLAHPYCYGNPEGILNEVADKIDGVECGHSDCTVGEAKYLMEFCKSKGLLVSGGSDYHGKGSLAPARRLGLYAHYEEVEKEIEKWIYKFI